MKKFYLLLLLFCFSCKKEAPIPETIYPLPYLPVYPGSYWKYLNQNGDTITQTTSSDYIEHRYSYGYADNQITDPVYVPFWNGKPVYGYCSPLKVDPYPYYTQVPYLSTQIGQVYIHYTRYGTYSRFAVNVDTSLVLFGTTYNNVIVLNDYNENPSYEHPELAGKRYYAKDIGLIMTEDFYDTLKIISYYINH